VLHNQNKIKITFLKKDENHTSHKQTTRVPFGSPPEKGQEPLAITMIGAGDNHLPSLDDPRYTKCLGGSNHQEKQANPAAKHNYQVPLDAIT
jgi:hypothetical protein